MAATAPARAFALVFVLTVFTGESARAQDAAPFRFVWVRGEGAGTCPDGPALAGRVAGRLGRNPFAETASQSIEGSVARVGDRLKAELYVRDAAGVAQGARQLSTIATDCVELADAVVLAVALTIDPNAALAEPVTSPAGEALTQPSPDPPRPSAPAPVAACPKTECPASAPCPPRSCPPALPGAHAALSARGALAVGVLPGVAPGAAVSGELGNQRARATLGMLFLPESRTDSGVAGFGLTAGMVGGALAWPLARGVELAVFGELEVGAIHAVVHEGEPVRPGDQPWFALGAGPRLAVVPLSPLRLELGLSLVVPLLRPSFEGLGLAEPVFQSSPVTGRGYIGVGLVTP
jgi:hypothetical protein